MRPATVSVKPFPAGRIESGILDAPRGIAGWAVAAVLIALAAGGAASSPEGALLGLPPWTALFPAVAVAGAGLLAARDEGRVFTGLAFVAVAIILALPLPGLRALSGPPLFTLVAAGLVAVAASGRRIPPRWLLLPAVAALYCASAVRVQSQVGPAGDEPHYLMVADSLLRDGDLSLEQDYAQARYRDFHPAPLAPHYRVRGRGGEIYSLHAVGLSLLILPAYAAAGYPGVSFFLALLAALLARELRELVRETTGKAGLAEAVGWIAALSPPLVYYAGLVFTEVPAALLVAIALRHGRRLRDSGVAALLGCAVAIAFLPWLNVRYVVLAALAAIYVLWGRPTAKQAAVVLGAAALSAAALAAFHWQLYGFFDPRRVYGPRPELSLASLTEGLPGLLLDQEFGLLAYAPVFVLAVAGLVPLMRRSPREGVVATAVVLGLLFLAGSWHMWRGGWNPPARFLLPALPALALGLAAALRRGPGSAGALLIGWGLWTGLGGALHPRLVHRDRDGTAPFFREMSGAEEWTRLLPGFVLVEEEPDRRRLAAIWGVTLAAAAFTARGRPTSRGLVFSSAALLASAAAASGASDARTGGRDAVRVIGRPALRVPGWGLTRAAEARWRADALSWGPIYEPHRHPAGAAIGDRLALPEGRYRVAVAAQTFGQAAAGATLVVRPEAAMPLPARRHAFASKAGAIQADFEVHPGERAVTLVVEGGYAMLFREIRLDSTFAGADGPIR